MHHWVSSAVRWGTFIVKKKKKIDVFSLIFVCFFFFFLFLFRKMHQEVSIFIFQRIFANKIKKKKKNQWPGPTMRVHKVSPPAMTAQSFWHYFQPKKKIVLFFIFLFDFVHKNTSGSFYFFFPTYFCE
jgi:Na+/melibiose symporter-like transporter